MLKNPFLATLLAMLWMATVHAAKISLHCTPPNTSVDSTPSGTCGEPTRPFDYSVGDGTGSYGNDNMVSHFKGAGAGNCGNCAAATKTSLAAPACKTWTMNTQIYTSGDAAAAEITGWYWSDDSYQICTAKCAGLDSMSC